MSFHTILGQNQGINRDEVVLLLARAAFRGGKIDLLPPSVGAKKAASSPTFLSELPTLKERTCLEKDTNRSSTVFFSDVLPGDPQYAELRDLMARSVQNSAKQVLWLMAGTRRPTEFGIPKGQTKADLHEPVSVLETIRNLLVLSCLPPDTAIDVMSGKSRNSPIAGSGESRIARDRISNLPRDATFASRVLYKSQDHQKEFDLSLFTYAPSFLRKESRSPASGLSVSEASDILASALLMIHVKAKTMTPQEAEKHAESLSMAIRKELLGKDIDWRDESAIATVPFTKGMLISFLSTAVSGRTTKIPTTTSLPLGEIWWERVK